MIEPTPLVSSRSVACASCGVFAHRAHRHVVVAEIAGREIWRLWLADLFTCSLCGVESVANFGVAPIAHRETIDCVLRDHVEYGDRVIAIGPDPKMADRHQDILARRLEAIQAAPRR